MVLLILLALSILGTVVWGVEETPHTRKVFYVGGSYVNDSSGNHVLTDQMYVEQLTPVGGSTKPHPLVFIHGLGQTGVNWLTKPDETPGWSSYFLFHGYECYILDIPSRGRSPWSLPPISNISSFTQLTAEITQQRFTAPEKYGSYPGAELHTQWPSGYGKGVIGDPVFDNYFASTSPSIIDLVLQQNTIQKAGAKLIDKIGKPIVLIGHSQGGIPLWLIADRKPELIHKIIALEPAGPPFQDPVILGKKDARAWGLTDIPLTYSPPVTDPSVDFVKIRIPATNESEECILQADDPPPRQLINLKGLRTAVVHAEASWHALYDWCTVRFLKQAGVLAELIDLSKEDVKGNGHMMMIERNSDEVAEVVRGLIEKQSLWLANRP